MWTQGRVSNVSAPSSERILRDRIATASKNLDDYLALANLLHDAHKFEEAVSTLRGALLLPLTEASRAATLTLLGWYVYDATGDRKEPVSLGLMAVALTEGLESIEAVLAKAKALSLIADCTWIADPSRSTDAATLALPLFARVIENTPPGDRETRYEIQLQSAILSCLLQRTDDASIQCREALQLASNQAQRVECLTELGFIERTAGLLVDARETLTNAIHSDGVAAEALVRPYYELGITEEALGKLPEARAKFRSAVTILQDDPALPRAYLPELFRLIGAVSYELDDMEEAAVMYGLAVESYSVRDPFYWSSLSWLAYCQWNLGQLDAARANFERLVRSSAAAEDVRETANFVLRSVRLEIAVSLYESERYAECIVECESLLVPLQEDDEIYTRTLLLLAHAYMESGNSVSARRYYERLLAHSSASPAQRASADESLARLGRPRC